MCISPLLLVTLLFFVVLCRPVLFCYCVCDLFSHFLGFVLSIVHTGKSVNTIFKNQSYIPLLSFPSPIPFPTLLFLYCHHF